MAENLDQAQTENQDQQTGTDNNQQGTQQSTQQDNNTQTLNTDNQQGTQTLRTNSQQQQDWRANLADEFKDDPSLEKFKDINGVVKSYKNLEKLVGREKIPVPPENATKEDWDIVYSRLGRPSNPNEYKIPEETLNKVPPEARDEEELKEFNKVAHESGLSGQQYQKLMDWYYDQTGEKLGKMQKQIETAKKEGETALRKEWGKAFDSKLQLGERVLNEFGTDELKQKITKAGLNNDPEFIKFLSQTGEGLSEDTISGKSRGALMTPDQAQREMAKIRGNNKHPYYDKQHPEHKFAVEKMNQLAKQAFPE